MRFSSIILISLATTMSSLAYPGPDTLWTWTYGGDSIDVGYDIQVTFEGSYILTGFISAWAVGNGDVLVALLDSEGDQQWTRRYGGIYEDYGYSVVQTSDGNYAVAGYTTSIPPHYTRDIYILKTGGGSAPIWTHWYGGLATDEATSIQENTCGDLFVAGRTDFSGFSQFYLLRTNSGGDSVWADTCGRGVGTKVRLTDDGGTIMVGYFGVSVYLVRRSESGTIMWTRQYPGGYGIDCRPTADSGFIVLGYGTGYNGQFFLIKVSSQGDTLWTKGYGSGTSARMHSIQVVADGGFVMAGWLDSQPSGDCDMYVVRTDSVGQVLWTQTYGGHIDELGHPDEEAFAVQQTPEGGFVLCGSTRSFGPAYQNVYVVKTDAEKPYYLTIKTEANGDSVSLVWIAPQTCDYLIYTSTDMGSDLEPPGPSWSFEATLPNIPAGLASWTDPAGIAPYKRYAVMMSCP